MSIYKQVVSCFPGVLPMGLVRSAENFKAFPRLTFPITYTPVQTKLLSPPPLPLAWTHPIFTLSLPLTLPVICIPGVQTVCTVTRCFILLAALVSYPQTRRKRSRRDEDKLDGAATWAALCLIFFIIINSPLLLLRSHIFPLLMCH